MGSDAFEEDLDKYLSSRRKGEGSRFGGLFKADKESEEDAIAAPVESVPLQKTEVVSSDAKVEAEYGERPGFFSRLFGWGASSEGEHDASVPQEGVGESSLYEQELVGDIRELARISIVTFRKLPAQRIREFKQSSDFERFKSILKKHKLTRE